jgi:hypothetical protein
MPTLFQMRVTRVPAYKSAGRKVSIGMGMVVFQRQARVLEMHQQAPVSAHDTKPIDNALIAYCSSHISKQVWLASPAY